MSGLVVRCGLVYFGRGGGRGVGAASNTIEGIVWSPNAKFRREMVWMVAPGKGR